MVLAGLGSRLVDASASAGRERRMAQGAEAVSIARPIRAILQRADRASLLDYGLGRGAGVPSVPLRVSRTFDVARPLAVRVGVEIRDRSTQPLNQRFKFGAIPRPPTRG